MEKFYSYSAPPIALQRGAQSVILQDLLQGGRDACHITGFHKAGVGAVLQHRRYFAHRAATTATPLASASRIDQRQAFVVRRQDQHVGARHQARHLLLIRPAGKAHKAGDAQLSGFGFISLDVSAAGQDHLQLSRVKARQGQRLQQVGDAFALRQVAGEEHPLHRRFAGDAPRMRWLRARR